MGAGVFWHFLCFTFHNVSINTGLYTINEGRDASLHSTMFLLILICRYFIVVTSSFTFHNVSINTVRGGNRHRIEWNFTFHNVSINTERSWSKPIRNHALHSTMFLLIRRFLLQEDSRVRTLHSTMFLLIRFRKSLCYIYKKWLYIPQCFY